MNPHLPDNQQDIDHDPTAVADEIYELACEKFSTAHPDEDQLFEAEEELSQAWEAWENEGRYL